MLKSDVSIIIPVYNGETWLRECIDSVLRQAVDNMEVIVVNDGSTDGSLDILTQYPDSLIIIDQPNRGAPTARNRGLERAQGKYVAMLDADDFWNEGYLARQLAFLESHPEVAISLERLQTIRPQDSGWVADGEPLHSMIFGASAFRRDLIDRLGLLDEEMHYCDDVEWFFRAQRAGVAIHKNDPVGLQYRRHGHNLTNNRELVNHYMLRALKKHRAAKKGQSANA